MAAITQAMVRQLMNTPKYTALKPRRTVAGSAESVGRFRRELDAADVARIEAVAADGLEAFGYD